MSDKRKLNRKVSFRVTDSQAREIDRMIERGMNPSFTFRKTLEKMMRDARRRRFG